MRDVLIHGLLGLGAGVGVGLVVRSVARSQLERSIVLGSEDLARRLREGRTRALRDAPVEVRQAITGGIDDGLRQAGLTRTELREYVALARRAQELIRRFS